MAFNYEDITIGDVHSFERVIDEEAVNRFAELTGDKNPLHMNEEYARKTEFGGRIAHGMLAGSLFSTLVGMFCPGERALYLSQKVNFRKPIRLGEKIKIQGEVIKKSDALKTIVLSTKIINDKNQVVIDGEAMAKVR